MMNKIGIKKEQRQTQLMEIALALFAEQGYEKTTIRNIAQKAGIAIGLLYNYFPSKEDLLVALFQKEKNQIQQIFLTEKDNQKGNRIEQYTRSTIKMVKQNPDFWRLFHSVRLQTEMMNRLNIEIGLEMEGRQKQLETDLHEMGIPFPSLEAKLIVATLDGLIGHYLINPNYPVDDLVNLLTLKYR